MSRLSAPFNWVERHSRAVALAVWLTSLLLFLTSLTFYVLVLLGSTPEVTVSLLDFIFGLILNLGQFVLLTCGALIIVRWPRHVMGWIFCGAGFINMVQVGSAYEVYAGPRDLPLLVEFLWLATVLDLTTILILLMIVPYLFPDGRLVSRRWLPLLVLGVVVILGLILDTIFVVPVLGNESSQENANPTRIASASNLFAPLEVLVIVAVPLALLGGVASMIVRYRRSQGIERLQIRWLLWVFGVVITLVLTFLLAQIVAPAVINTQDNWTLLEILWGGTILIGIFFGIPAVLGLAILRYRLYSIDLIINRTIVYATLTVGLGAIYTTSVILSQQVLNPLTGNSDITIAGATLLVAVLFQPLRQRIQSTVDRHFYRIKYDAERTVQGYSTTARQEVNLDHLLLGLSTVVMESLQPASVSIWLREHRED